MGTGKKIKSASLKLVRSPPISKDECGEKWDGLFLESTSWRKAWETDAHTSKGVSDGSSGLFEDFPHLPSLDGVCCSQALKRSAFTFVRRRSMLGLDDNLALGRHHLSFFLSFLFFATVCGMWDLSLQSWELNQGLTVEVQVCTEPEIPSGTLS